MVEIENFLKDASGDAVVESAILFPVAALIFAALVLASAYLPAKASLQRATQLAATAISVEKGDTWLSFDEKIMEYYWADDVGELKDVYAGLIDSAAGGEDIADKAEAIVKKTEEGRFGANAGELTVECAAVDYVFYNEITVTASRDIQIPVDLSFIGFPKKITVAVSSTAVTQNGDEFIRNMGLAADFSEYISEKYGITGLKESICDSLNELVSFMGWK